MLTVFARKKINGDARGGGSGGGSNCDLCTGAALNSYILDVPASASYSRGVVLVGYNDGSFQVTGSSSKSTGSVNSPGYIWGGNTAGGDVCDTGQAELEVRPPTSALVGYEYRRTKLTFIVNGQTLATVYGNFGGGATVFQTVTWTRTTADQVEIYWDSEAI
jgi:hypothetical protein